MVAPNTSKTREALEDFSWKTIISIRKSVMTSLQSNLKYTTKKTHTVGPCFKYLVYIEKLQKHYEVESDEYCDAYELR